VRSPKGAQRQGGDKRGEDGVLGRSTRKNFAEFRLFAELRARLSLPRVALRLPGF
jgi:hypothetical protein